MRLAAARSTGRATAARLASVTAGGAHPRTARAVAATSTAADRIREADEHLAAAAAAIAAYSRALGVLPARQPKDPTHGVAMIGGAHLRMRSG